MKRIILFLFLVMNSAYSLAQPRPVLASVISFEELQRRQVSRTVAWVNPNGKREEMTFVEMAIPVGSEMKKQILEFNSRNYHRDGLWLQPAMVVIHAMDLGNLQTCLEQSSFLHDHMPSDWGRLPAAGRLPNGAHFFVDTDGVIFCLTPPIDSTGAISYRREDHRWFIRRHADANPVALGIENVTPHNLDLTDLSPAQVVSNAKLVRWLSWFENGQLDHLIGHHQLNDQKYLNQMLDHYNLHYDGMPNRTIGRKDVGMKILEEIRAQINEAGYNMVSDFDR